MKMNTHILGDVIQNVKGIITGNMEVFNISIILRLCAFVSVLAGIH